MLAALALPAQGSGDRVVVATLTGVINPITATYVDRAVDRAVSSHAAALVIAMDTPGGLDTSMRQINKRILGAPLPVVVFVSPPGARAASAGLFITAAADVAAMAPGTNIGSAHHVGIGGINPAPASPSPNASPGPSGGRTDQEILNEKIENDAVAYIRALSTLHHHNADWAEQAVRKSVNVPADEALKLGVVDLMSRDLSTLLQDIDGRSVTKGGQTYTLQTARAGIDKFDMSQVEQLLQIVADPNIAYYLLLLAIVALGFWVTHPAFFVPGVIGAIAALLAALALFNLPVNLAGLLLILLAVILFAIDVAAPTHGVLTTGGIIAMTLGSILLINTNFLAEGVNVWLVVTTVVIIGGSFGILVRKLLAARRRPVAAGEEAIVGRQGTVREALKPEGLVFVDGALWQATSLSGPLDAGSRIRVVAVDGLQLRVEALQPQASSGAHDPRQPVPG